jgi:hypothetical protein
MLPQQEPFSVLCEFLMEHRYAKVNDISFDKIHKLAIIVLTETFSKRMIGEVMRSCSSTSCMQQDLWLVVLQQKVKLISYFSMFEIDLPIVSSSPQINYQND